MSEDLSYKMNEIAEELREVERTLLNVGKRLDFLKDAVTSLKFAVEHLKK